MQTRIYPPMPQLRHLIQYITSFQIDFTEQKHLNSIHFFTPTHTQFVSFNLSDDVKIKKLNEKKFKVKERSLIYGAQTIAEYIDLGKKHTIFIAHFCPGVLHRILKIKMTEIANQTVDSELVFGNQVNDLIEMLIEEKSDAMRNYFIQSFLFRKLKNINSENIVDSVIELAIKENGNISVNKLAELACMSVRQFERKINERIGMSPKLYSKLIRFSHATTLKEINPAISWSEIAYQCGYFDQTHLIKDFKTFTGDTPKWFGEETKNSTRFKSLDDYYLFND